LTQHNHSDSWWNGAPVIFFISSVLQYNWNLKPVIHFELFDIIVFGLPKCAYENICYIIEFTKNMSNHFVVASTLKKKLVW